MDAEKLSGPQLISASRRTLAAVQHSLKRRCCEAESWGSGEGEEQVHYLGTYAWPFSALGHGDRLCMRNCTPGQALPQLLTFYVLMQETWQYVLGYV